MNESSVHVIDADRLHLLKAHSAMQHLILQNIAKHIKLTADQEIYFLSLLKNKKIRKKQFLSQEGDVSKGPFFVTKGILRSYTNDKNGFDHILQFAPPGWWIADMQSLVAQQPGSLNIDAIEDSDVLLLPKNWKRQPTGWGYSNFGESPSMVGVPTLVNSWYEAKK